MKQKRKLRIFITNTTHQLPLPGGVEEANEAEEEVEDLHN